MKTPRRKTLAQPAIAAALLVAAMGIAGGALGAETGSAKASPAGAATPRSGAAPAPLIDINSASRERLKALPGIDDAAARRIVAGRPYLTKADLVTEKVLPAGVYQSIRKSIVAVQKLPPREALARRAAPR